MFSINWQGEAFPAETCAICHGFCWIWRSQELHNRFLGAVCWLITDVQTGNRGQNQRREAPAWLKSELGLHIPHLQQGAAVWQQRAGREMALPWISVRVAAPSCHPARAHMEKTPSGSWGWMMFHSVQWQCLLLSLFCSSFYFKFSVIWKQSKVLFLRIQITSMLKVWYFITLLSFIVCYPVQIIPFKSVWLGDMLS